MSKTTPGQRPFHPGFLSFKDFVSVAKVAIIQKLV
jgi:hypothetical protein